MIADLFSIFSALGDLFLHRFFVVLAYPLRSEQRIFVIWLFTSLLFALFVFFQSLPSGQTGHSGGLRAFLRFLFPAAVWRQRSAWLDVRYFFFHQVFRVCLAEGILMAAVSATVLHKSSEVLTGMSGGGLRIASELIWGLEWAYALLAVLLSDFVAYALHYYQHKNPLLWEFHKVHHSPSVMHPLTNYREHPIDNLFYALGHGAAIGLSGGVISWALGYVPATPTIFGVTLFSFLFNALGYNLRHSHIWLRWPGKWGYVFGCPAHHHIHHSCSPEHVDKNFAFLFPVWDVVFGTFCLPDDNSKVKFGLGDGQEDVYTSCLALYFLPLKKGLSQLRAVFLP
ncbi:sterol desaturase family protein [Candidatus Poriferisocius sp.]|uniref:sterol desaturase family protein n=1 Tax=Candidatus Poriferisocius sp. TaxID=3101276 RepID=UPI003B51950A